MLDTFLPLPLASLSPSLCTKKLQHFSSALLGPRTASPMLRPESPDSRIAGSDQRIYGLKAVKTLTDCMVMALHSGAQQ